MANANGLPFFFYFILKLYLIFIWHKAMRDNKEKSTITKICRYFLWLVTLSSGLDDMRHFIGSLLTEQAAGSSAFKAFSICGFAAHLILLPCFWMIGVLFATFPNHYHTNPFPANTICFGALWIMVFLIYIFQQTIGVYTFTVEVQHLVLSSDYRIYRWTADPKWIDDTDNNWVFLVGDLVPIIIVLWIQFAFGVVWCKYKYWRPFVIDLCCILGLGAMPFISDTVFFFTSNLWEFLFFYALFVCDRWLYGPKEGFKSVRFMSESDLTYPVNYVSMETTSTKNENRKDSFGVYNI